MSVQKEELGIVW